MGLGFPRYSSNMASIAALFLLTASKTSPAVLEDNLGGLILGSHKYLTASMAEVNS
jgi:hypothetical protein